MAQDPKCYDAKTKKEIIFMEKQIETSRKKLMLQMQRESTRIERRLVNMKLHQAVSHLVVMDAVDKNIVMDPSETNTHLPEVPKTELRPSTSAPNLQNIPYDELTLKQPRLTTNTESRSGNRSMLVKSPSFNGFDKNERTEKLPKTTKARTAPKKEPELENIQQIKCLSLGYVDVKKIWLGEPDAISSVRRNCRSADERTLRRIITKSLGDLKIQVERTNEIKVIQKLPKIKVKSPRQIRPSENNPYPVYFRSQSLESINREVSKESRPKTAVRRSRSSSANTRKGKSQDGQDTKPPVDNKQNKRNKLKDEKKAPNANEPPVHDNRRFQDVKFGVRLFKDVISEPVCEHQEKDTSTQDTNNIQQRPLSSPYPRSRCEMLRDDELVDGASNKQTNKNWTDKKPPIARRINSAKVTPSSVINNTYFL